MLADTCDISTLNLLDDFAAIRADWKRGLESLYCTYFATVYDRHYAQLVRAAPPKSFEIGWLNGGSIHCSTIVAQSIANSKLQLDGKFYTQLVSAVTPEPATPERTNADRVETARVAIEAACKSRGELPDEDGGAHDLVDLLSDLRHYCGQHNIMFADAVDCAEMNYLCEVG